MIHYREGITSIMKWGYPKQKRGLLIEAPLIKVRKNYLVNTKRWLLTAPFSFNLMM